MSGTEISAKWDNVAVLANEALVQQHASTSWFRRTSALRPEHSPFNHVSHPRGRGLIENIEVRRCSFDESG